MNIKGKSDITEGKMFFKIVKYVIPLMLTHMLQVFYSIADMMVVDLSGSQDAVGAIGTTVPFVNLIINLCIGFATGTTVVLGYSLGAKNDEKSAKTVHTSLVLAGVLGLLGAALGISLAHPLLSLMGAQGQVLELAVLYIRIYLGALPFIAVSTYVAAIFRAMGNGQVPLWTALSCGAINLGLNVFFVKGCGMSVDGVATATFISNFISTVIYLYFLAIERGCCRFSFRKLSFDKKIAGEIFKAGLPVGVQSSLMSLCNMYVQSSVLSLNNLLTPEGAAFQPIIKGDSAVTNLEYLAQSGIVATSSAAIVFTSRHRGARKPERIPRLIFICAAISFGLTAFFCGMMLLFNKPLLSLYGVENGVVGSAEALGYNTALMRLLICTCSFLFSAVSEISVGCSRGLGSSTLPTVIDFVCQGMIPVLWCAVAFPLLPTAVMLYLLYPISRIISAIGQSALAVKVYKRNAFSDL